MSMSRPTLRLHAQEFMPKNTRKKSGSQHVAFKLDAEHHGKLAAEAKDLGISVNLHARDMLLRTMNEPAEVMAALFTLNQQLFAMREELALMAEVLLSDAGKRTREEAQKWADENIKPA